MAVSKRVGETFVRKMREAEKELIKDLGMDSADVSIRIGVTVTDVVAYDSQEDED